MVFAAWERSLFFWIANSSTFVVASIEFIIVSSLIVIYMKSLAHHDAFTKLSGTFVYLPENNMLGFIHPSERYAEPRLGQVLEARVIGFREVDRTLNLSLKPRSFEMLENDAQMILTYLESNGGFMTLNDKSSPADIKATFGISKGQFKKALGGLMKAKKVKQDQFGTELIG